MQGKCASYRNVLGKKLKLINHSKKAKPNHLHWGKLHLNHKGLKVFGF